MTDDPIPPTVSALPPKAQGLIARVQAILLKPAETWDVIANEPSDVGTLYKGYVIPLAAIGPIAAALGSILFGIGVVMLGGNFLMFMVSNLLQLVVTFIIGLAMVYVTALVIDGLAPSFDGEKNQIQAFKVAAYSMTAGWVAGILLVIPFLGIVAILALIYNIYLLYVGLPKLMKVSADKAVPYTAIVVVVCLVLYILAGLITMPIRAIGGIGMASSMFGHHALVDNNGKLSGSFTVHGKDGSATVDLGQLQAAANQMAAQASAMQNSTAAPVKVADAGALQALMPQSYMGAALSDTSTESGGAAGIQASTATGHYTIGDGSITLKISDMGTMAGVGAMMNAAGINASSSSGASYSKMTTEGNRITSENYDGDSKSGEYSVVLNGRITVEGDGNGVDINAIKGLVNSVDLNKAMSLTQ